VKPSAYRARRAAARCAFRFARQRFFAAIQSGRSRTRYRIMALGETPYEGLREKLR
jgi:hypothetical protein